MNNMFAFVFSIIIGNNYNYIIYFLVSFFSHFLLVSAHRCVCDFSVLLKFITTPTLDLNYHRVLFLQQSFVLKTAPLLLFFSFVAYLFMFLFCLNISCVLSFLRWFFVCLFSSILFSIKHSFSHRNFFSCSYFH
uniref:(northern house mosquito) hypothetical protein n=1 Tax=Culex pipiens TaxID=7175 RepID=A0A8D8PJA5_CULPI